MRRGESRSDWAHVLAKAEAAYARTKDKQLLRRIAALEVLVAEQEGSV